MTNMFLHHCDACSTDWLQGTGSIIRLHNTTAGPIGLVECPHGHQTIVNFRTHESFDPTSRAA